MPSLDRAIKMDEALRQFSRAVGADYIEGDGPYVPGGLRMIGSIHSYGMAHVPVVPWTVAVGSYTATHKGGYSTWTQLYASYVNPDGFRFSIHRTSFLRRVGETIGLLRDLDVGFPEFDAAFAIDGTDEKRLHALFGDSEFRATIEGQTKFGMKVWDTPWLFAVGTEVYFPEGVDVLVLQVPEAVADVDRLKTLFEVLVGTLERLCRLGLAREEPTGVPPWGLFGITTPKLTPPPTTTTEAHGLNGPERAPELPHRGRQLAASSQAMVGNRPVGSLIRAGCLAVSGSVFLLSCAFALFLGAFALQTWRANNLFQRTSCVVLDRRLDESKTAKGNHLTYKPAIHIRYEVEGKSYEAWTYEPIDYFSSDRAAQQAIVDRFSVGSTVSCWYDPDNPASAVLVRQTHSGLNIALTCVTMVVLLSAVGLGASWWMKVPVYR